MSETRRPILPAPVVPVMPRTPKPRGGRRGTTWTTEQAQAFGRKGGQARAIKQAQARQGLGEGSVEESTIP